MKRPQTKAGVGKPTSGSGARGGDDHKPAPAPVKAMRETGKILASVTDLAKVRGSKQSPAKQSAPVAAVKRGAVKRVIPAKPSRVKGAPGNSRKLFERLSPEAARFRSYSRQRRAVLISIVGSFTALLLLMLASMFTPMLAVESIRVTGLDRLKPAAIQAALKGQMGKPLPMIQAESVGEDLKSFALIESYAITARPPHTLIVRITERSPICVVEVGGKAYLYDPAGVRIDAASGSDKYPLLAINGNPANSAEYRLAIDVLLALPATLLPRVYAIDAKTKDNVTMQLRGNAGQAIVWGDASNSALKSKVLAALLRNYKKGDRVTFDVSSPNAPVVRY
ncbi:MAG: hypothetical protein RLZ88_252 [Actinomycetota bacterium]